MGLCGLFVVVWLVCLIGCGLFVGGCVWVVVVLGEQFFNSGTKED